MIADKIIDVLKNRKGFDGWWHYLESEDEQEILEELNDLVYGSMSFDFGSAIRERDYMNDALDNVAKNITTSKETIHDKGDAWGKVYDPKLPLYDPFEHINH